MKRYFVKYKNDPHTIEEIMKVAEILETLKSVLGFIEGYKMSKIETWEDFEVVLKIDGVLSIEEIIS
jgi:hypothetical protein